MFAEMGEERAFLAERRHLRKGIQAEVAPLKLALAEVAPLGKDDGLAVVHEHRQRVTMDEVLGQDKESGPIEIIPLIQIQILGEDLKHIRAALSDIICQDFNPVSAHHRQQGEMSPLKVGLAEFGLYGSQLSLQDRDKEVPAPKSGLQKTRVNALAFAFDEVEHLLDQPLRREHLSVVGNALFGLDQTHSHGLPFRLANTARMAVLSNVLIFYLPDVVEVLHPAVTNIQHEHRIEFSAIAALRG